MEIARGNGEHILVLDDEKVITKLSGQILEKLGYQVWVHHPPLSAAVQGALKNTPPDFE